MDNKKTPDYAIVTEVPGIGATGEQLARLYHRYGLASRYCHGKSVLEVACGAGLGLGYLGHKAARIVGGDYTSILVRQAQGHYRGRIDVMQLDAHSLPFQEASFDTVVLFEAIYYLGNPGQFLQECRRVLSSSGVLVLCTVNKEWSEFNPSPFSRCYYSAQDLMALFAESGFDTDLFGAFPATANSSAQKAISLIKRTAVWLNLIPRSMKGKEWLKRMFYGRLVPLPAELEVSEIEKPSVVSICNDGRPSKYKILYAIGHLR